ncbi:hypothetical protein GCM10022197_03880 [Microlunatus spumicola]|uniref:Uncharacterized protein n=1 Tax=Microlunatus spumicola TaxID=81499 RepID=A0ABP6WIR6_9ACTN
MTTEPPQTPDVDLPGQHQDGPDLDIEVEPEPDREPAEAPEPDDASADDPALGNTLIRPENS